DPWWRGPPRPPPRACRDCRRRGRRAPWVPREPARGSPEGRRATPRTATRTVASSGLLLIRALMLHPVAALVGAGVLRPRLRLHVALGTRDDLELAVLEDLADEHRAVRVVVVLVHLDGADGRRDRLAVDGLADGVDLEALGL